MPDFSALVRSQRATVVNVRVFKNTKTSAETPEPGGKRPPDPGQESGLGSGFVVSANGVILTNRHVVANADRIRVRFSDRREMPARVLGVDPLTDLAVLKVDAKNLPTVMLGNSASLQVGQWVLAIGAPLGLERTATHGIISALGRSLPNDSYVSFIQTDVPINPGNSGGPLFDQDGRVVGINSQIVSSSGGYMGLSFAIPINDALWVAKQIVETGQVKHGWLGVSSQEMTLELANAYGLEAPRGALVNDLAPGGPAERAGLLPGDIIIGLEHIAISETGDLPPLIGAIPPGTEVTLDLLRERKTMQLRVPVGELGRDNLAAKTRKTPLVRNELLGVGLANLDEPMRQVLNLKGGLLVEELREGPAMNAGVRIGDILLQLGQHALDDASRLPALLASQPTEQPLPLLVKRPDSKTFLTLTLPKP